MEQFPIKLMIVDDHQLFIDGIKAILRLSPEINVIAEALNGEDALTALKSMNVLPDVLISDISMPGMKGDEMASHIAQLYPEIRILVLSMHNDIHNIDRMIGVGVRGYILKNTGRNELIDAINKISNGENYYSEEVKSEMVGKYFRKVKEPIPTPNIHSKLEVFLSRRERQIVKFIIDGFSNGEIAESFGLSIHTITSHRKNIYSKLKVNNTAQLIECIRINNINL
jgi:DNA-binding NarL/FixJ family response regulator